MKAFDTYMSLSMLPACLLCIMAATFPGGLGMTTFVTNGDVDQQKQNASESRIASMGQDGHVALQQAKASTPIKTSLMRREHPAEKVNVHSAERTAGLSEVAAKGTSNKGTRESPTGRGAFDYESRYSWRDASLNLITLASLVCCTLLALICVMPSKVHTDQAARLEILQPGAQPKLALDVVLVTGRVLTTLAVTVDEVGSKIKMEIENTKGAIDVVAIGQLLIGGSIVEDHVPLIEYGPFTGTRACVLLLTKREWTKLSLEGKWLPTRTEEWQPPEWRSYVKHRIYDSNNRGVAFDVYGGMRPRGPYRLTSRNPPVWESKISGPDYTGTETLKVLPGGHLELHQMRSNIEGEIVSHYVRQSRVESFRCFLQEVRLFLMPWEREAGMLTDAVPATDWLDAI